MVWRHIIGQELKKICKLESLCLCLRTRYAPTSGGILSLTLTAPQGFYLPHKMTTAMLWRNKYNPPAGGHCTSWRDFPKVVSIVYWSSIIWYSHLRVPSLKIFNPWWQRKKTYEWMGEWMNGYGLGGGKAYLERKNALKNKTKSHRHKQRKFHVLTESLQFPLVGTKRLTWKQSLLENL